MAKKISKHFIIPIFIPNLGCPQICIFCKQKTITNSIESLPKPDHIKDIIETAIKSKRFRSNRPKEVAFYGGTFTSLPIYVMEGMLDCVKPYKETRIIHSIRLSTRPDCLDADKLDVLDFYGVSTVELGAQSMNDKVLSASNRGHTSDDTVNAVKVLKKRGFNVGIQLMPGLPGDTEDTFMDTIGRVISLKPDIARLYPTLVIRGTGLEKLYKQGEYLPLGLQDAVSLCKKACIRLESAGIPVIRIGLMSSPSLLEGDIIAGPWHPSLGSLVRSAIHLEGLKQYLPAMGEAKTIIIHAPHNEIPLITGHKKSGIEQIESITGSVIKDIIPDDSILPGQIVVRNL